MDDAGWSDGSEVDEAEIRQFFADDDAEGVLYGEQVDKAVQICDASCTQSIILTAVVLLALRAKRKRQRQQRIAVVLSITTSLPVAL